MPSKHLGDVGEIGIDISIGRYGMSVPFGRIRQTTIYVVAYCRALCLADPDVQTIFVTPYVDEDRIEYFKQLIGKMMLINITSITGPHYRI